jgi:SAM-dependent methyltransferase
VTARDLSRYADRHRHFYHRELHPLLLDTVTRNPGGTIADLGSGDGAVLWSLNELGLLGEASYAIDLSPERVARAERISPKIRGIVADVANVAQVADQSLDGVIASQVIEHLSDDRVLAPEIARLLKPGGWWYVGSILRGRYSWWIYRVDGGWRLDPTHIREYRQPEEFLSALVHQELRVEDVLTSRLYFPALDLLLRALGFVGLLPTESLGRLYIRSRALSVARRLRVRVPGYWLIEARGRKIASIRTV